LGRAEALIWRPFAQGNWVEATNRNLLAP
jgi:hypothetical protein